MRLPSSKLVYLRGITEGAMGYTLLTGSSQGYLASGKMPKSPWQKDSPTKLLAQLFIIRIPCTVNHSNEQTGWSSLSPAGVVSPPPIPISSPRILCHLPLSMNCIKPKRFFLVHPIPSIYFPLSFLFHQIYKSTESDNCEHEVLAEDNETKTQHSSPAYIQQ